MKKADESSDKDFQYLLGRKITYDSAISINKLHFNDMNPRMVQSIPEKDLKLDELCRSILDVGILVPLVVYKREDGDFVVLDGERRLRAALKLHLSSVPVNILPGIPSKAGNLSKMFMIHMQREPWNTAARAVSLLSLMTLIPGLSDQEYRKRAGMKINEFQNAKRIINFREEFRQRAIAGTLNPNYLIEMDRSLEDIEKYSPELMEKFGRKYIEDKWVAKIDSGIFYNNLHLRNVGTILRELTKDRAIPFIVKLIDDSSYSLEQALSNAIEVKPRLIVETLVQDAETLEATIDKVDKTKLTDKQRQIALNSLEKIKHKIEEKIRSLNS
jgi:hypothetical protein